MTTVDELRRFNFNCPIALFINNPKRAMTLAGNLRLALKFHGQSQKHDATSEIFIQILFICSDSVDMVDVIQKSQTINW